MQDWGTDEETLKKKEGKTQNQIHKGGKADKGHMKLKVAQVSSGSVVLMRPIYCR